MKHSEYRPSASNIWLKCLGSLEFLNDKKQTPASFYAKEGIEAHEILYNFDKKNFDKNNEKEINAYYFYKYIDLILKGNKYEIKREIKVTHRIKEIFGFVDYIAYNKKEVHIVDYKYGKYVKVKAYQNTQLLMYAILSYYTLRLKKQNKWTIHVVQPRIGFCDSYSLDKRELLKFNLNVVNKYKESLGKREYKVGEDQCRFCPGARNLLCSEFINNKLKKIKGIK